MTLEDASGFDMASTRSNRDKLDGDIPLKRLNSDDDIKVWATLKRLHHQPSLSNPPIGEFYCSPLKPEQPVLSLACTQIMIKLIRPEIERSAAAT